VREDVGINLTLEDLDWVADSGIDLTVSGQHGFIDFTIPGPYVAAFRDRILEHRGD